MGHWMKRLRPSIGKGWDKIHCHTPDSSGCHHSWFKHQFQALHTSFFPELMHPLHPELLRWHFPNRYFPLKSRFLEEAFVLFKQSQRLCLRLLMDKKHKLSWFLFIWEREDAFAVPSKKGTPGPKHQHLMAICPAPGQTAANSPGLQQDTLICWARSASEMQTGEDEAILPAPPPPSFLPSFGLLRA